MRRLFLGLIVSCLTLYGTVAQIVQLDKIVADDRKTNADFGYSVGIDGEYAVSGAWGEDFDENNANYMNLAGAAYIFKRDNAGNWNQIQKIVASDRQPESGFGHNIAISGDYIMVGSIYRSTVYIFKKDVGGQWVEVQKITDPEGIGNQFGRSMNLEGNRMIIGRPGPNPKAFIYELNGSWSHVATVQPPTGQGNGFATWFGCMDIFDNHAVVGADFDQYDEFGANYLGRAGGAYVYQRDGSGNWNFIKKLVAFDRETNDQYGYSTTISSNFIAIGSIKENNQGAVYTYDLATFALQQKITAPVRTDVDYFGGQIDLQEGFGLAPRLLVGSLYDDEDKDEMNFRSEAGSAYLYEFSSSWELTQKLSHDDRASNDYFGFVLDQSGESIIVGARGQDTDENSQVQRSRAGAAYIFGPCNVQANFTVSVNGCSHKANFTDVSTGTIQSWNWDFGDGSSSTNGPSTGHTYAQPGNYTITLTVTDQNGCTSSTTSTIFIGHPGTITIAPSEGAIDDILCIGDAITYNATSSQGATSFNWSTTLGTIMSGNGTDEVVINVTNPGGQVCVSTTSGCGASVCEDILAIDCCAEENAILNKEIEEMTELMERLQQENIQLQRQVNERSFGIKSTVLPNPSTTGLFAITIEKTDMQHTTDISITDAQGKVVHTEYNASLNTTLDLSSYAKGVYYLKVINGDQVDVQKIVFE